VIIRRFRERRDEGVGKRLQTRRFIEDKVYTEFFFADAVVECMNMLRLYNDQSGESHLVQLTWR
jgi:hypothetical protein